MTKVFAFLLTLLGAPAGLFAKSYTAEASFYHDKYEGRRCADGSIFKQDEPIVATYLFPLGARVKIEYTSAKGTKRVAYGVVRDRGPAEWLREQGREFDLSRSLFKKLESPHRGVITVTVTEVKSK